ncbi:helix-turn-helix transcriptional regulator [Corynebacterium pacaense]|uniref:helix-turn-helix transcriptional regulator n=1 Tax=Corynebacterium pacaense TaxID=1816684 RepID=UPI0009BBC4C9|nr:hypothetical protein [Corynebacterium pacaense]
MKDNRDNTAPPAVAEFFTEFHALSAKQREVLNCLRSFPRGARAADVAGALDMHVNTARGHLDELHEKHAVRVVTAPTQGRGRPSLVFSSRVPDNRAMVHEYISLIELMSTMIADRIDDRELREHATAIGAQWAAGLDAGDLTYPGIEDALGPLLHRLRQMGFDPSLTQRDARCQSIVLNSCPFVKGGQPPSRFVCTIHEGFIKKLLGDREGMDIELNPLSVPGGCTVELRQTGDADQR